MVHKVDNIGIFVLLLTPNEVWGKVKFSQASVIPSVRKGVFLHGGLPPEGIYIQRSLPLGESASKGICPLGGSAFGGGGSASRGRVGQTPPQHYSIQIT